MAENGSATCGGMSVECPYIALNLFLRARTITASQWDLGQIDVDVSRRTIRPASVQSESIQGACRVCLNWKCQINQLIAAFQPVGTMGKPFRPRARSPAERKIQQACVLGMQYENTILRTPWGACPPSNLE
ncbi:hypothetical protein PV04_06178 [Phialophora macrospora]|uniref:Uncharacterized protein n=1 Tax=Phialophora macrospora TaxID=1851006 RepID=A0A0D2G486_9EURO|nr:hypothetical protein PV04_06178 [Phialophora macrospora]